MADSPLLDAQGFTRNLEVAYRQMWQTWCARTESAMQTIDEALKAAVELHRAGNVERAASMYRQILEGSPRHAPTLHLLGTANFQLGQYQLAAEQLHAAICIDGAGPNITPC